MRGISPPGCSYERSVPTKSWTHTGKHSNFRVEEWKGLYGSIKPTVQVGHELAAECKGNIYVCMTDLIGGLAMLTPFISPVPHSTIDTTWAS